MRLEGPSTLGEMPVAKNILGHTLLKKLSQARANPRRVNPFNEKQPSPRGILRTPAAFQSVKGERALGE
jgi:hypothetical protein